MDDLNIITHFLQNIQLVNQYLDSFIPETQKSLQPFNLLFQLRNSFLKIQSTQNETVEYIPFLGLDSAGLPTGGVYAQHQESMGKASKDILRLPMILN
jgi:hypothetical protein